MGNICVGGMLSGRSSMSGLPSSPRGGGSSGGAGSPAATPFLPMPRWHSANLEHILLHSCGSLGSAASAGVTIADYDSDGGASSGGSSSDALTCVSSGSCGRSSLQATSGFTPTNDVPTLQSLCVAAVAQHWDVLPAPQLSNVPRDLLQCIADTMVSQGSLTSERLSKVAWDLDTLDLSHLSAGGPSHQTPPLPSCRSMVGDLGAEWVGALVGGSPRLRHLNLACCTRVGDSAVRVLCGGAPYVTRLQLGQCVLLTDGALHSLAGLPLLSHLDLQGCENLTGEALHSLAGLTRLRHLNLAQCGRIKCGLAHLSRLRALEHLDLGWCRGLQGGEGAHLGPLTALTHLSLAYTRTGDGELAQLQGLSRLMHLDLQGCGVSDLGLAALAPHLPLLTHLTLSHCSQVSNAGVAAVGHSASGLVSLDLSYTGTTNAGLEALQGLVRLVHLNLDSCAVSDSGVRHLRKLHGLQRLVLNDTNVRDGTLVRLGASLCGLRRLQLSSTKVTGEGVRHLSVLTALQELNLDVGALGPEVAPWLAPLVQLVALDLFSVRLDDAALGCLTSLSRLQRLEVCGGAVTDAGCRALCRLPSLTWLSLAHNRHVGDKGVVLLAGALHALEVLNLSHTGVLSAGVAALTQLQGLRSLALCHTGVTESAVRALQATAGPRLQIKHSPCR